MVDVKAVRDGTAWRCEVTVEHAGSRTQHTVRVSAADMERWGGGLPVEDLVRRSFEFLLEREAPTSILRSFDLAVIQRYFPDFDHHFRP
ncbi:MAG TPA: hypothetical protein VJR46_07430 [Candidatus Dormibacteraeota bacterium]|nr:hypothetical protein [Candidatus Dormibacteraeota bacterium]